MQKLVFNVQNLLLDILVIIAFIYFQNQPVLNIICQILISDFISIQKGKMLINRLFNQRLFSTFKVSMDALKKLRQQTSAPMGECKRALEQSQGNHQQAFKWLKQKGLMSAAKRQNKQTREGVVSAFVSPCRTRAVLLQANCETDFVAKSQMFLKYVNNLGHRLLERQQPINIQQGQLETKKQAIEELLQSQKSLNVFPQDKDLSNASEQLKVLISRLQQNIRIRRVVTLHSDNGRYGVYVHQAYQDGIGMQICMVQATVPEGFSQENLQSQVEIVGEFTDNIAAQILGAPPKYLKADEIPMDVLQTETDKVRQQMAKALQKAPQAMHEKMISGKLNSNFYSQCFLPSMNYILSNDGIPVSQYWQEVEQQLGKQIVIESSKIWQCK